MGRTTSPVDWEGPVSLSRKRKKELRKLQTQANKLWESQQVLVGEAAAVAREARRQLGNYSREQVVPQVQADVRPYAAPYVDKGVKVVEAGPERHGRPRRRCGRRLRDCRCGMPRTTRARSSPPVAASTCSEGRSSKAPPPGSAASGAGGVIAIILGVAAALGILTPRGRRFAPTTSCGSPTTRCARRMPDPARSGTGKRHPLADSTIEIRERPVGEQPRRGGRAARHPAGRDREDARRQTQRRHLSVRAGARATARSRGRSCARSSA